MPYWRLSGFYFFYFASLGVLLPYWTLYLDNKGFNAQEIGELIAVMMLTKVLSPYLLGIISDHFSCRMQTIRWGSFLSLVCFVAVFYYSTYWPLLIILFVFSFFWNATLPQFEVVTLNYLQQNQHAYSHIRVWGSVGFIFFVVLTGYLVEQYGIHLVPTVLSLVILALYISSLLVQERNIEVIHASHLPLHHILLRKEVLALLFACFFLQASHGPYYTFYSIYLQQYQYGNDWIGAFWALSVIAEVILFLYIPYLLRRYTLRVLFFISVLLAAIRWIIIAYGVESTIALLIAQCLHAASFGLYHTVAIQFFHYYFPGKHQGQGQAIYSSVSFGLGGAIGSLYSGYLWQQGYMSGIFLIAGIIALLGCWLIWRYVGFNLTNRA